MLDEPVLIVVDGVDVTEEYAAEDTSNMKDQVIKANCNQVQFD